MRKINFVRGLVVQHHEDPPSQTRFQKMEGVTCYGFGKLCSQHERVAVQCFAQRAAYRELAAERGCGQAPRRSGTLNVSLQGRHGRSQGERHTDHSFGTDQFDVEAGARGNWDHERYDAGDWKVRVSNALAGLAENIADGQRNFLALRDQPITVFARKDGKQAIWAREASMRPLSP